MTLPERLHAALPGSALPRDLAHQITTAMAAVDARLRAAYEALSAADRDRRRADGGWSLHSTLEHMALTNEAYLAPMRALVPRMSAQRVPGSTARWRSTFVGKWLARSLAMRVPLPAPRRVQPGPTARPDVLDAVIGSHRDMASLMAEVADMDWTADRLVSPLNALVRMNFGDACVIVLRHSERHAAQIDALVAQLTARRDVMRRA